MLPINKLKKLKGKKEKRNILNDKDIESYTTIMSTYAIIDLFSYELVDYPDRFNEIKELMLNDIKKLAGDNEFCKLTRNIPIEQVGKSYNIGLNIVNFNERLDMSMLPKNNELDKNSDDESINTQIQAHILKQCTDVMLCVFLTYQKYATKFKQIGELKNIKDQNGNLVFPQTIKTTDPISNVNHEFSTFETLLLDPNGGGLYLYTNPVKKIEPNITVTPL